MMSEFSPELIDYLDGKISFEEFEKRRSERKAKEKESKKVGTALIYSKTKLAIVNRDSFRLTVKSCTGRN